MANFSDTQNRSWAEDKLKFGYRMLEKMGWSEGKGLGAQENGMLTHIKVRKKTSNSGVGANLAAASGSKVPAQVAEGLNEVLARLSASTTSPATATPNRTSDHPQTHKPQQKQSRGYLSRRTAGKTVGTYSETALREIFGGASLTVQSDSQGAKKSAMERQGDDSDPMLVINGPEPVSITCKDEKSDPDGRSRKTEKKLHRKRNGRREEKKRRKEMEILDRKNSLRREPKHGSIERRYEESPSGKKGTKRNERFSHAIDLGVAACSGILKHRASGKDRRKLST